MEIIEKVIGNLSDESYKDLNVDYVNFDWDETRRRTQKVTSEGGISLGIRLNLEAQTQGLNQDDILSIQDGTAIAVNINETEVIVVSLESPEHAAKVAYEIGNRHAPTFFSEDKQKIMTPYNNPMMEMLEKIHAHPKVESHKLLNSRSLSSVTSDHSHTHGEKTGKIVKDLKKQV